MRANYGSVFTSDQHPEAQYDALTAADRDAIFTDEAGGKPAQPPDLPPGRSLTPGGRRVMK